MGFHGNYKAQAGRQPLFLDVWRNALFAFSLRKLRTDYTGPCIQIIRSDANTTIASNYFDVYFVNDYVDVNFVMSLVRGDNVNIIVSKWYDQSGNNNHLNYVTGIAGTPQIVTSRVLNTQNGIPAINMTNAGFNLTTNVSGVGDWCCFNVNKRNSSGTFNPMFAGTGPGPISGMIFTDNTFYIARVTASTRPYRSVVDNTSVWNLTSGFNTSNSLSAFKNSVAYSLGAELTLGFINTLWTGYGLYGAGYCAGVAAEAILYQRSLLTQRLEIENNIRRFYRL